MRTQYSLTALLSAAALLAACETNTGPDLAAEEPGPAVVSVAPSNGTIEGEEGASKKPVPRSKPGPAPCLPGKC
jgi:hypothetical protein